MLLKDVAPEAGKVAAVGAPGATVVEHEVTQAHVTATAAKAVNEGIKVKRMVSPERGVVGGKYKRQQAHRPGITSPRLMRPQTLSRGKWRGESKLR